MSHTCPTCGRTKPDFRPLGRGEATVHRILTEHLEAEGTPPTLQYICERMGWSSQSTAHEVLSSLVDKGWVERLAYNQARSYVPNERPW